MYKNWRCNSYLLKGDRTYREFGHHELQHFFDIHGQQYVLCNNDFEYDCCQFKEGQYYAVTEIAKGFELGDQVTTYTYFMFESPLDNKTFFVEASNRERIYELEIQGCARMGLLTTPYGFLHHANVIY